MDKDDKKYELGYILEGNLEDNAAAEQAKEIEVLIEQKGGTILERMLPKKKKLAYKIGHNYFGHFGTITFTTQDSELVSKVERDFKLKKDIVRFLFVKLGKEQKKEDILAPKLRIKKAAPAPQVLDTSKEPGKETEPEKPAVAHEAPSRIKLEELDQKLEEILGK